MLVVELMSTEKHVAHASNDAWSSTIFLRRPSLVHQHCTLRFDLIRHGALFLVCTISDICGWTMDASLPDSVPSRGTTQMSLQVQMLINVLCSNSSSTCREVLTYEAIGLHEAILLKTISLFSQRSDTGIGTTLIRAHEKLGRVVLHST